MNESDAARIASKTFIEQQSNASGVTNEALTKPEKPPLQDLPKLKTLLEKFTNAETK